MPPIFQSSLFVYDSFEAFEDREKLKAQFMYTRLANPTTNIAESKIAALEETERCRLFGSGMGAISAAILSCVEAGKHIVATHASYLPAKAFMRDYLPQFGVETTFVDGRRTSEIEEAIKPNTSLIYMESPGTFLFHVQDVEAVCSLAKERGITTVIDNSCATPYFQKPAKMGADLVVHSATKYLAGHSDIVAGAVCGSEERLAKLVWEEGLLLGSIIDPFAAWLLIRSLRSLPLRMERHQKNAKRIAEWLESHERVERVHYPGLPSHESYSLVKKQMSGASGLLSFIPKFSSDRAATKTFCESLKLFQMGVSWGGHESLIAPLNYAETGNRWLLRLSIGLETAEDLIADLEQAFAVA